MSGSSRCLVCKLVAVLVIIGALNWGLIGLLEVNLVEQILGASIARVIYILVGLSGLALLASYFMVCPACKKQ